MLITLIINYFKEGEKRISLFNAMQMPLQTQ